MATQDKIKDTFDYYEVKSGVVLKRMLISQLM